MSPHGTRNNVVLPLMCSVSVEANVLQMHVNQSSMQPYHQNCFGLFFGGGIFFGFDVEVLTGVR